MTEDRLPLTELLAKAGDGDFLRSMAEAVAQLLMETDVEGMIGAGAARGHGRAGDVSQRLPRPDAGPPTPFSISKIPPRARTLSSGPCRANLTARLI